MRHPCFTFHFVWGMCVDFLVGGENLCKGNYFFNFFLEEFWGGSMLVLIFLFNSLCSLWVITRKTCKHVASFILCG